MDRAHELIIKEAQILAPRSVIDFGCGNGLLLKKFRKYNCRTFGVDSNPKNHPDSVGDIFDFRFRHDEQFDLALISQQRIEEEPAKWEFLLQRIRRQCMALLVYDYRSNGLVLHRFQ